MKNDTSDSTARGLWTAQDVAAFMRCSVSYVYKAAERGVLPCIRIGRMLRFSPESVRTFVAVATSG